MWIIVVGVVIFCAGAVQLWRKHRLNKIASVPERYPDLERSSWSNADFHRSRMEPPLASRDGFVRSGLPPLEQIRGQRAETAERVLLDALKFRQACDELVEDEADSLTIRCAHPEPQHYGERYAVDCCGDWTNWQEKSFSGGTRMECLDKAVKAKRQWKALHKQSNS